MTREQRNAAALAGLYPEFRTRAAAVILAGDAAGRAYCILQGRRTFEEQAALHAKGRTVQGEPCWHFGVARPIGTCDQHPLGARVTNAVAGRSFHNYGLAIDIVDFAASGDREKYDPSDYEKTDYAAIARIGLAQGMRWGGAWRTNIDRPHLEWSPGYGERDAFKLSAYASDGFLTADFFSPGRTTERTA